MAWTTPKTWVFEDIPLYTDFNTLVRDNQSFLYLLMDSASGHNHSGGSNQGPPIALGSGSFLGFSACIPASTSCTITSTAASVAVATLIRASTACDFGAGRLHLWVALPDSGSNSHESGSIRLEGWRAGSAVATNSIIVTNIGISASRIFGNIMVW